MTNFIIRFLYPLCVIEFDEILDLLHTNPEKYEVALKDYALKHPEKEAEFATYVEHITRYIWVFKEFGQVPIKGMGVKLLGLKMQYVTESALLELKGGGIACFVLLSD